MGWGRYLLLGDIGQQFDLSDLRAEVDSLRAESATHRGGSVDDLLQLQRDNDELKLYVVALVRLLISKGVVTRTELETLVNAVDAEDGKSDGRYAGEVSSA